MTKTMVLLIMLSFLQMYTCLHLPAAVWTDEDVDNLRLTHMVYWPNTDTLFIGATNYLYHLEGKDLTYLNHVRSGPVVRDDEPKDNDVTIIVLDTNAEGEIYITLCRSAIPHCVMRNASDLSGTPVSFRPAVRTQGALALSLVKAERRPPRNRIHNIHYTFYACPHSLSQSTHSDSTSRMCYNPGLRWPNTDGNYLTDTQINFKQFSETDIVTEKYIASTAIEDFRIFFSIQRNKTNGRVHTKIAQVCQYKQTMRVGGKRTTTKTYVDMELRCGNYTVMTDVEKILFDTGDYTGNHFVATFTNKERTSSGVCLYSYKEIKAKLVENIKNCYIGIKPEGRNNYIDGQRCGRGGVSLKI